MPEPESKVGLTQRLRNIEQSFHEQFMPEMNGMAVDRPDDRPRPWMLEVEETSAIVEYGGKFYRVPFTEEEDGHCSFSMMTDWEEVRQESRWVAKLIELGRLIPPAQPAQAFDANDTLIAYGGEVKALGNNKVGGYLVRFSSADDPDLEGDFFTKDTDFGELQETAVYFHHRLPVRKRDAKGKVIKEFQFDKAVGRGKLSIDDVGVFMEAVIEMRGEYEEAVKEIYGDAFLKLVGNTKLGLSSGTASHLVDREPMGNAYWIKAWPLGLDASLTPTPAEPRTRAMPLKSLLNEFVPADSRSQEGQEMPGGETAAVAENIPDMPIKSKEREMADENKEAVEQVEQPAPATKAVEIDYDLLAEKVAAKLDPPMKSKAAPVVIQAENLGDPDPFKGVTRWLMGDNNVKGLGAINARLLDPNQIEFMPSKAYKAALQEGTAGEGGNIVPNDFYGQIVMKRDQLSIPRRAGARVIRTSRDVIDIPYEDTSMTNFVITAEEGAYDENEPTFGNLQVTVYKLTKLVKVSEELIEDEDANLDGFLADAFGRAWGLTENNYTLVGSGSSQPQGVFVGGSVGYTFADTNSITATEIPSLYWSLGDPYHDGAVWVTRSATVGHLQGLTGNNFQLVNTPPAGGMDGATSLWGKPLMISDSAAALATGAKTIIFGNWNYYALVERHGLVIQRNPYLYQGNGQIGIFAKVRMGGGVIQSEAFKWGIQT